jgi:hypothetical protein
MEMNDSGEPGWLKTISNHAVITRDELLEWIKVNPKDLLALVAAGFPSPRFGSGKNPSFKLTSRCRWRVGEVRAWLAQDAQRLSRELQTEVGAEQIPNTKRAIEGGAKKQIPRGNSTEQWPGFKPH